MNAAARTAATLAALLLLVGFAPSGHAEEAPQAGEQAPQETDFVRDLYAAWADRDALARALQWVAAVADIDMPLDQHGNTALHYAAPARLDVLRAIVARGADCDARNGYGASPLHVAAAQRGPHGQTSGPRAVALLAQCGADPDLRDNLRVTPLHAVYASVELGPASRFLNTIVLARVPYDSRDRWRDAYEAGGHVSGGSGGKSTQVLRALLEAGADPDGRDVNGATPLMMAVKTMAFTYGEHIPLLLKHEADADARDIAGRTAAMHAIFSWDSAYGDDYGVKAIAALLAGGADPDVQDEEGATALIHAVRKESFGRRDNGGALREVELLLAGGADPCIADRGGRLPWDYAQEGSLEQDLLRQAGGMPRRESFEITNFDGSTYDALGAEEGCDTEARMAEAALLEEAVVVAKWQAGEVFRDCLDCPEMVVVPAGSFTMGSPSSEGDRWDDEGPQHRVTISRPFAVGVHEVTVGEFARFVSATGRSMGDSCWAYENGEWEARSGPGWRNPGYGQTDGHPVACVSWEDARAYVEWLSRETGAEYRLLSEAEWEYAARAGTVTARYWGEGEAGQCRYANGADEASKRGYPDWEWPIARCDDGAVWTAPVGSYEANGFGLHDVLGNVWEWVADCWNDSYAGAPGDGSAWQSGDCGTRVLRGGSWFDRPGYLRSALHNGYVTGDRDFNVGFRAARTLSP